MLKNEIIDGKFSGAEIKYQKYNEIQFSIQVLKKS